MFKGKGSGFTLIEVVVVMLVTAVVAGIVSSLFLPYLQGYVLTRERAELSEKADLALRRIALDVRGSLPNSIRTGFEAGNTIVDLEMMEVQFAGVYRAKTLPGGPCVSGSGTWGPYDYLLFMNSGDTCFSALSGIRPLGAGVVNSAIPRCGDLLVVYNMGLRDPNLNAYIAPTLLPPPGQSQGNSYRFSCPANSFYFNQIALSTSLTGEVAMKLDNSGSGYLARESPDQRYQIVRYAVMYVCDINTPSPADPHAQTIYRYQYPVSELNTPAHTNTTSNYWIPTPSTVVSGLPNVTYSLVADGVTSCDFEYSDQGLTTTDLQTYLANFATLYLGISVRAKDYDANNQDNVALMHQVHVSTLP